MLYVFFWWSLGMGQNYLTTKTDGFTKFINQVWTGSKPLRNTTSLKKRIVNGK